MTSTRRRASSNKKSRNWTEILASITFGTSEADLENRFVEPLLKKLRPQVLLFSQDLSITGNYKGKQEKVTPDYVCWKNNHRQDKPILIIEDEAVYPALINNAIEEVQKQMIVSSAQFGLATNGLQIQLFQRHGKICVPRTRLEDISVDNINKIITDIKDHLNKPRRALTVMFWTNKGGVGKTTVTANIAAALAKQKNLKVLIVNFDLQSDINRIFGVANVSEYKPPVEIYDVLDDVNTGVGQLDPMKLVRKRQFDGCSVDIIPGDRSIMKIERGEFLQDSILKLLFSLTGFYELYDYIFIDASPAWRRIAQVAAYAADLVIPIVDNSGFSVDAVKRSLTYHLIPEEFEDDLSIPPEIAGYIINSRFQNRNTVENSVNKTQEELDKIGLEKTSWIIPNYAEIQSSVEKGKPVVFSKPNGKATQKFIEIAKSIFLV